MDKKIIMLVGKGISSTFTYNGIKDNFIISHVIIEEKIDRKKFIKRRIKKLGFLKVLGQILFQLTIPKLLEIFSQKRINEIKTNYNLDDTPIPSPIIKEVSSVNSRACIKLLKKEKPDLIIINGTRIISKKVLNCINTTFINTHAGITPKYRGVHGGYWALANQDKKHCGVTVHLVDSGIDTGGILFQQNISPTPKDNFLTYTYLQMGEGINLINQAITDFHNGVLIEKNSPTSVSKLWYHPTLWFYLYKRIIDGVK